jgi:tripartite-type tricarboxylate transporter receptor subunit TctC
MTLTRRLLLRATVVAAAASPLAAFAAYPDQPIKMVVAYAAGGGTDIIARLAAQYVQKYLGAGASIVVVNRPGAGGGIGFTELSNSPPDGYTIGFINTPNVVSIPIERKAQFHWQNLELLGNLVDDPSNFSVLKGGPIKTLADLVTYAKAHPGEVTYGTTGIGSDDHLAAMNFERKAGVKLTHIPFKGAAEVLNAVVGKQVMVASMNIGEALQYESGGSPMINLGQMSVKRSTLATDLPTFREQGFDIVQASLRGMAAPKGLPPAVRDKLVEAVRKTAEDPEFKSRAAGYYAPLRYLAPAAYAAELKGLDDSLQQLWKTDPWTEK